jgi:site-specific DNA recombinase
MLHTVEVPLAAKRRGVETHLIIGAREQTKKNTDQNLIRVVAKAKSWFEELCSAPGSSINMLAEREGLPASEVSRRLPLAFLSPQIVRSILHGRQPIEMTTTNLLRLPGLPMDWDEQAQVLGFPSS